MSKQIIEWGDPAMEYYPGWWVVGGLSKPRIIQPFRPAGNVYSPGPFLYAWTAEWWCKERGVKFEAYTALDTDEENTTPD